MARLDIELVSKGIARSRERAKQMIKADGITVNGKIINKPSYETSPEDKVEALIDDMLYVGRGALKLEKAAIEFELDFTGKTCLDIGASTGGFTDFMLRNGAEKVFAVDVGHDQLDESLRNDSRVINAEGTDIRDVTSEFTDGEVDFISADVSFISIQKILPKIHELLKTNACAVVLIKPQFEVGQSNINKHGIVKDRRVHENMLRDFDAFAVSAGFDCEKYIYSPIKGGSGNIEYLVKLVKVNASARIFDYKYLTECAFNQL